MAEKKDLPVNGALFFPYAQAVHQANVNAANGSHHHTTSAASSNFNPLLAAAIGFNPMAAGYPAAAFYSSPFTMLPFAANSVFMNSHAPPNILTTAYPPAANPVWPGLLPPDYLLNIAALQSLHQPNLAPSVVDNSGETFNDVLKKMPRVPVDANDGATSGKSNSNGNVSISRESIPSTSAAVHSSSSGSKTTPSTSNSANARPSSSMANSFSATSLAVSDQKRTSPSSVGSATIHGASSIQRHQQPSHHHHASSLATLAEIASSLQSGERYESRPSSNSKSTADQKTAERMDVKPLEKPSTSQPTADQLRQQSDLLVAKLTSKSSNANSSSSVLDFSRKRSSSKMGNGTLENGEVIRKKEPKLERPESRNFIQQHQQKQSKKSEKEKSQQRPVSSSNDNAAANATNIFGTSLSSDLKMDPNLLNASAMAWAALSNQLFFANVQNELLNRAAAAANQQQQSQQPATVGNVKSNSSKSPAIATETSSNSAASQAKKARTYQKNEDGKDRRSSRGRPATISASTGQQKTPNKDAVDVTIDAVIKQQQQAMVAASNAADQTEKSKSKRGRGSRGGITVREQLAARRGNQWTTSNIATPNSEASGGSGTAMSNGCSTNSGNEKANSDAAPQLAALDLSVKSHAPIGAGCSTGERISAESASNVKNGIYASNVNGKAGIWTSADDSSSDEVAAKKRQTVEANAIRQPLLKGWRRQTYIRAMSPNSVRGDVIYYAPCGKRVGSYAEIMRYLNKHDIRDIDRDNFSFSSKILVGEFLHVKPDGGKNGVVKLSEKDVRDMLAKLNSTATPVDNSAKTNVASTSGRRSLSQRSRRRGLSSLGRRNASRRSTALQARFGASSDGRRRDLQQSAENRPAWEAKRLERERDTHVLEHDRKRKMDAMRNQKVMEAMQRAKAKELRQQQMESLKKQEEQYMQQMVLLANMEREKVRQQMLFTRALEARRRQDEKERLYAEKLIRKEERMAARTASLMKMRQLRQPVEDMELDDSKELPPLNRMENMQLDGQAFADLLMVMEFVNNFGHVLKIEKTEIPSISDVHAGLMNDRHGLHALRGLVKTLLLLVLEYPGLPGGSGGRTLLGQPAKDVGVTDMNLSELLRMFLMSRDEQGKALGRELNDQPYESLTPSRKASILAYMCNELLYCRNVVREIEGSIDVIAKFKSDRWSLEGKIRHMKVVKASKRKNDPGSENSGKDPNVTDDAPSTSGVMIEKSPSSATIKHEEDDDEDGDSSDTDGAKTDGNQDPSSAKRMPKMLFGITAGEIESISKEEKLMSVEEVDKELERLSREMHDLRSRVNEVSVRVRASPFGQDRYNRYYWILPHYAGVFVEGIESGAANNPAIRTVPMPARLPSPVHPSGRGSSPNKHSEDVRLCLQDIVETVSRSSVPDFGLDLGTAYLEVKLERLNAGHQDTSEPLKSNSIRTAKSQGKRMKPVPMEMQRGWWLIDRPEQLDSLPPHLLLKGIRERQLNRTLTKHGDHVKRAAFQAGKAVVKFGPVDAPSEDSETITLRTARRLLNMIRQLEEKVFHANVHVRGWKLLDTAPDASPPHSTGDNGSSNDSSCDSVLDASDKFASHSTEELLSVVKDRLLQLELSIERRYFLPAFNRDANKVCAPVSNTPSTSEKQEIAKQIVDARISDSLHSNAGEAEEEESDDDDIPLALERWRNGVGKASNIAQLSMCLEELDAQVAWEKSVMKASCQICRGGDNESQLLLCDGCDLGYHTYCFKPKLDTVPEGDWFCPECIAKATRRPCCLLCCRQTSRPMIACTQCSKNFHLDCLLSPVKKGRNGSWTCNGCCNSKAQAKNTKSTNDDNQNPPSAANPPASETTPPKKKPAKKTSTASKTAARPSPPTTESGGSPLNFHELCSIMLAELDAHKDAGPFRLPVDMKGCPLYKKVIKQPMDLSSIQTKLTNKKYENEVQFINDVKLMFDNCRTFNEDDSAIGKAGRALWRYFNRRWKELKGTTGKKQ